MKKYLLNALTLCAIAAPLLLTGCSGVSEFNEVTAERIARPAFMVERKMETNNMDFQLWERMHERYSTADIYIEGDGGSTQPFAENAPTPENPVALHLASRDLADNVAYISRPCQYRESQDSKKCAPALWSNRRFSPEVFAAYNAVLDNIKAQYNITQFNLIGYDGGANIAAILSGQRKDVASLRTVAGTLVPPTVYDPKKQPLDADSLSAADMAPLLANIPQHHFIGAGDDVVPTSVYHSFRQSMGPSDCVHYTFVQDADHTRGWVEKWPDLLNATTRCVATPAPAPLPARPVDKDASHGMK